MNVLIKWLLHRPLFALFVCLGGCSTNNLPYSAQNQPTALSAAELALIDKANLIHRELIKKDLLLHDPAVHSYLMKMTDRLSKAMWILPYDIEVFITKDPLANAYAYPNGHIYITTGLVAELENEPQLAFILAHEIEHINQRHGLEKNQHYRYASVAISLTANLLAIPAYAQLTSHSRSSEIEADRLGMTRLIAAGYNPNLAASALTAIEQKESDEVMLGLFASHPPTQERTALLAQHTNGVEATDPSPLFLQIRHQITVVSVDVKLSKNLPQLALRELAQSRKFAPLTTKQVYQQARAYQIQATNWQATSREIAWLRGQSLSDQLRKENHSNQAKAVDKADELYIRLINQQPSYLPALKARGLMYGQLLHYDLALKYLTQYQQLSIGATKDKQYVNALIGKYQEKNNE